MISPRPADALPNETAGNGCGNDALAQTVSSLLAEQYGRVAETVAKRVVDKSEMLALYDPCWLATTDDDERELACVRKTVGGFAEPMYRRPLAKDELSELIDLYQIGRTDGTKEQGVKLVLEALLQGPDFLYRFEWGEADDAHPGMLG